MEISFMNSGSPSANKCKIISTSLTKIICETEKLDKVDPMSKKFNGIQLSINGAAISFVTEITVATSVIKATKISPTSVSPVLKGLMEVTIENTYPVALKAEDFTVELLSKSAPEYIKPMRVFKVDTGRNVLICKYGGAWSGDYGVRVKSKEVSNLDSSALAVKVEAELHSITPNSGSIFGGTLITLTGKNWGKEFTDNPVEIYFSKELFGTDCLLEKSSPTEIKCRVFAKSPIADGREGILKVHLKVSETSNCMLADKCKFTFT